MIRVVVVDVLGVGLIVGVALKGECNSLFWGFSTFRNLLGLRRWCRFVLTTFRNLLGSHQRWCRSRYFLFLLWCGQCPFLSSCSRRFACWGLIRVCCCRNCQNQLLEPRMRQCRCATADAPFSCCCGNCRNQLLEPTAYS